MTQRVSKRVFIWSIAGGYALGILLLLLAAFSLLERKPRIAIEWLFVALVPLAYGAIVWLCLVYVMWQAIQDGHARVTPGTAVGFLFIPFFCLYWVFRAVACFPKDYNNFVDRHELNAQKLEPHMFVACSVLSCTQFPIGLPLLVITCILASRICDAINAIPLEAIADGDSDARRSLFKPKVRSHKKVTPGPFDLGAQLKDDE
ncbi:MAG TPA: hypothetical protein VM163_10745 [bacterium]|nr:hypothetical protein [bacterium]